MRFEISNLATRVVVLPALLIGMSVPLLAQSQPVPRDETAWQEIRELDRKLAVEPPSPARVEASVQLRRSLLGQARFYLAAYPGGPRRDEAVRLELNMLFEIGTLSGGAYEPLQQRVAEYLRHPPSEPALHEAAYWAICCRRLDRAATTSAPSSAPILKHDHDVLAAYRRYVERYPHSRYVPRMVSELFDVAAARGDRVRQRRLVGWLEADFPQHAVTSLLKAQLHLQESIGQPFALVFESADGRRVDTALSKGRAVLIVVWAGASERARQCAGQIEAFRRDHPELEVIGVNLDESKQRMNAACRALGLAGPQFHDGLGWASELTLRWGVRDVPRTFVLDRQGRLAGVSGDEGWRELALAVLAN